MSEFQIRRLADGELKCRRATAAIEAGTAVLATFSADDAQAATLDQSGLARFWVTSFYTAVQDGKIAVPSAPPTPEMESLVRAIEALPRPAV